MSSSNKTTKTTIRVRHANKNFAAIREQLQDEKKQLEMLQNSLQYWLGCHKLGILCPCMPP